MLPFTWGDFFLKFIIPVVLVFSFFRIIMLIVKRRLSRSKVRERQGNRLFRTIRLFFRIGLAVFFVTMVGVLFGERIFYYLGLFFKILKTPLFSSGSTQISFVTLILAIPVFYAASWIARLSRKFLDKSLLKKLHIDDAKKFTISSILRYGIMVVVLLIGLSIIGIDLSSITVIFGVLGLGVGFGLQSVVANFFAGLTILITRPIKEGDRILVEGIEGEVVKIRLQASIINTLTNETIIVPNSQLISEKVYNFSYEDRSVYIKNVVQVSYRSDLDKVLEVLMDIGIKNPFGIDGIVPIARVTEFADSGITMTLFTKIQDVVLKYDAISWTNIEIWRNFKKHKIEIPFPQVDLHIKNR